MAITDRVAVILGQGAIADDKQLHILEQAGARPETVALVAIDLIEGLADIHPTALELHMHHWQTIDQYRHVVTVDPLALRLILIDDLQAVVVDVLLVDQVNILDRAIVTLEHLDMVFLDACSLFDDAFIGTGNTGTEKTFPFRVGKFELVQLFQLEAQIGDKISLRGDW